MPSLQLKHNRHFLIARPVNKAAMDVLLNGKVFMRRTETGRYIMNAPIYIPRPDFRGLISIVSLQEAVSEGGVGLAVNYCTE